MCSSDLAERAPNIAIINAYNDMLSAHAPLQHYPDIIKAEARLKEIEAGEGTKAAASAVATLAPFAGPAAASGAARLASGAKGAAKKAAAKAVAKKPKN